MKLRIKKLIKDLWLWFLITFGCILSATGYVLFILPKHMVEGGVTGIGIIIQHITGLPIVGTSSLVLTALIFIVATRKLGKKFGAKSIYATILLNLLIDLLTIMKLPVITDDMLLSAFYGGAIVGLGLGIIYFAGAATGGADAIAQLLWKLKRIRIGRTLIVIDALVLSAATIIFIPIEMIMYSLIFIFVEIKVIDNVLNGVQANQRLMIITDRQKELKDAFFARFDRGMTIIQAEGGYTGSKRFIATTVVPQKYVPEIKRLISDVDPRAFVIVHNVHQVYGEGFEPLPPVRKKETT